MTELIKNIKKAEASVLAQLMMVPENYLHLATKIFPGMFPNYKGLAEVIFQELEARPSDVSLPFILGKYPQMSTLLDEIMKDDHAAAAVMGPLVQIIRDHFFRGEEIKIHQEALAALMSGTATELVINEAQGKRDLLNGFLTIKAPKEKGLHDLVKRLGNAQSLGIVKTGFEYFDRFTGSMMPDEFWVIGARPSMGKTTIALEFACRVAAQGHRVPFFSLEMGEDQMNVRLLSRFSGIHQDRIRQGAIHPHEWDIIGTAVDSIVDLPLEVECGIYELHEIVSTCRKYKMEDPLGLVVVDYLQLINAPKGYSPDNRNAVVGAVSRKMKQLTSKKDLDCPVMGLSQLSRKVIDRGGDKRPNLADLRDSGQIEQDADVVGFVHRPEYYNVTEDEEGRSLKGVTYLNIEKHRNGGKIADYPFRYDHRSMTYTEATDLIEATEEDDFAGLEDQPSMKPSKLNEDEDMPF